MSYKRWFIDFVAAAILLSAIFYWWDSAPPIVLGIAAFAFLFLVFRLVIRSWKGFISKSHAQGSG
jgi:hypothetical protein